MLFIILLFIGYSLPAMANQFNINEVEKYSFMPKFSKDETISDDEKDSDDETYSLMPNPDDIQISRRHSDEPSYVYAKLKPLKERKHKSMDDIFSPSEKAQPHKVDTWKVVKSSSRVSHSDNKVIGTNRTPPNNETQPPVKKESVSKKRPNYRPTKFPQLGQVRDHLLAKLAKDNKK